MPVEVLLELKLSDGGTGGSREFSSAGPCEARGVRARITWLAGGQEVLPNRDALEQLERLERPAHSGTGTTMDRPLFDPLAVEGHGSLRRANESRNGVDDCGLAGPIGADQA
jgi:hypothetical protein